MISKFTTPPKTEIFATGLLDNYLYIVLHQGLGSNESNPVRLTAVAPLHLPAVRYLFARRNARIEGHEELGQVLGCLGGVDEAPKEVVEKRAFVGDVHEAEAQVCCAGEPQCTGEEYWSITRCFCQFPGIAKLSGSPDQMSLDVPQLGHWEFGLVGAGEDLAEGIGLSVWISFTLA